MAIRNAGAGSGKEFLTWVYSLALHFMVGLMSIKAYYRKTYQIKHLINYNYRT
jgi:hypothetical protein